MVYGLARNMSLKLQSLVVWERIITLQLHPLLSRALILSLVTTPILLMHTYLTSLGECAARILTIKITDSPRPVEESVLAALSEHHAPRKGQSQVLPRSDIHKLHLSFSSTVVSASFAVMWKLVNVPHQWVVSLFSLCFSVSCPQDFHHLAVP